MNRTSVVEYGDPWLYYANIGVSGVVSIVALLAAIRAMVKRCRKKSTGGALTRVRIHVLLFVGVLARLGSWVATYFLRAYEVDTPERYAVVVLRALPTVVFFTSYCLLALFWSQLLSTPAFARRGWCQCRFWGESYAVLLTLAALGFVAICVAAAVLGAKGVATAHGKWGADGSWEWIEAWIEAYLAALSLLGLALVAVSSSFLLFVAIPSLGANASSSTSANDEDLDTSAVRYDDRYDDRYAEAARYDGERESATSFGEAWPAAPNSGTAFYSSPGAGRGAPRGDELDHLGSSSPGHRRSRSRRATAKGGIGRSALTTLFCSTSLIALVASVALVVRLAASVFFALPLAAIFGHGELVPLSSGALATFARLRIVVDSALPLLCETLPTICLLLIFGIKPRAMRKKGGRGRGGAHDGSDGQREHSASLLGDEERAR
jgi:hypothetical protein